MRIQKDERDSIETVVSETTNNEDIDKKEHSTMKHPFRDR